MSDELPYWCVTAAEIRAAHANGLEKYGGLPGEKHSEVIDGVSDSALQAAMYELPEGSNEPDQLVYASRLLEKLANQHLFEDGNKRVAFYALEISLAKAGLVMAVDRPTAEAFMLRVAGPPENRPTDAEIQRWIGEHIEGA